MSLEKQCLQLYHVEVAWLSDFELFRFLMMGEKNPLMITCNEIPIIVKISELPCVSGSFIKENILLQDVAVTNYCLATQRRRYVVSLDKDI